MALLDSLATEFLELKRQRAEVEERMAAVRSAILSLVASPVRLEVGDRVIEVRESARRVYDPLLLRGQVPRALFEKVIEVSPGKVSALIKAGLLTNEQLAGSYKEIKVTALVVK